VLYPTELRAHTNKIDAFVAISAGHINHLILLLLTACMNDGQSASKSATERQKTQFANLARYTLSGIYFARIQVHGKLIRKSLKTDAMTVAKLRRSDLESVSGHSVELDLSQSVFFVLGIQFHF
jgi:hypothetical protein